MTLTQSPCLFGLSFTQRRKFGPKMEASAFAGVSLMIMYEDESVDVHYRDGARLQLSPCGCEFMLLKAADPHGHPLQPSERVRQRTRFTVSSYKDLIVAALGFRNTYASRPYLPDELISIDHKKPFFNFESNVQWPDWTSYEAELGPGGEVIVKSEDGRAKLVLSLSGEEFSVEFTCNLSQSQNQHQSTQCSSRGPGGSPDNQQQVTNLICDNFDGRAEVVHQGKGSIKEEPRSLSCSARLISAAEEKPEEMYQSTTVVQLHSCAVASTWAYPLSLARHHWTSHLSKNVKSEGTSNSSQADRRTNISNISCEDRRSLLPQALPLTCPSPHWHRWKFTDTLAREEVSNIPRDLVKIVWCQGVTYRVVSGAVPVLEVSPGDGSVIRSNGVLDSYFTHHKPGHQSEQVTDLTYHLSSLPPDVFGQVYSVRSIVSRASRILACYNQAKQLLRFPATPSCLQEDKHLSEPTTLKQNPFNAVVVDQCMTAIHTDNRSYLVAAELEKIKRFNFLLENSHLLQSKDEHADLEGNSTEATHKQVNDDCIAEALQRTAKAIQDIDDLTSADILSYKGS